MVRKKQKLRIFILNASYPGLGMGIEDFFIEVAKKLEYSLDTRIYERYTSNIPTDYDCYLLHLSDTTEEAIEKLREKQPWCKIFGISGASKIGKPILTSILDGNYFNILNEECVIEEILRKTQSIYEKK